MKLEIEKIKYLDTYLEKSGVSFWDVRAELVDHFAAAIEDKMMHNEYTFEDALQEVNKEFGNTSKKKYVLNEDNTKYICLGTFSDGEKFKELERKKRKQVGKKYAKLYWKQFIKIWAIPLFLLEYSCFIVTIIAAFLYFGKWATLVGTLWMLIPMMLLFYKSQKEKAAKKSLHVQVAFTGLTLMPLTVFQIPNIYKQFTGETPELFWVLAGIVMVYPFIKASIMRCYKVHEEYKNYYQMIAS